MKYLIEILLLLLLIQNIYAEEEIEFSDVLSASLVNLNSRFKDQNYKDFSPAWFDDIEIRTETHDFELRQQEYSLRFSPVSVWVRAAQQDFYESKLSLYDNDKQKIIADNIKILYENWLSLVIGQEIISISDSLKLIYEDEEIVRKRLLNMATENVDRFIDFREKKNDMTIDHLTFQREFAIIKNDLLSQISIDTNIRINSNLIDLEIIRKVIVDFKQHSIYIKSFEYMGLQIEKKLVNNELKIEEAENTKILDFLQLSYRGPHDDPMNERLNMTMALRLPLAGRNKMKTELLRVEELEMQNKIKAEEQEFIFNMNEIMTNIAVLFGEYDVMKEYSDELLEESGFLGKNLGTPANSPFWLISNKKNLLKTKLKLLEISKEIYFEYIDLLDAIGVFALEPGINYLEVLPDLRN